MPQTFLTKARANAARIGVTVKPSRVKGKKLDVYKGGKKVASIGDIAYSDFLRHGDRSRQANYLSRHAVTRKKKGSPSYYAAQILWR